MKATRRELRRAVGPAALGTIQAQDQAIGILQNAVTGCQREIASLAVNHAEFKKDVAITSSGAAMMVEEISQQLNALRDEFDAINDATDALTLWGRLRWLFTGQ